MFAESLKDLVRFLRRDDTTCEIRRQLGYSEVLQNVCSFLCYFLRVLTAITIPLNCENSDCYSMKIQAG